MATTQQPGSTPGTHLAPTSPVVGTIGNAVALSSETSASGVAAQAKAAIEARYLMALHRPRNWMNVRSKMLDTCDRPGFAEVALYGLERWDNRKNKKVMITGPSIRFAEEAARQMGNVMCEAIVTYDDHEKRIVRVMVTDLEANLSWPTDVVVAKVSERSRVYDGQTVLRSRQNSDGKMVYIVQATEDDLANKQNAMCSKAFRNAILRLLPGDILEEAVERVQSTVAQQDKADPKAALKRMCDRFFAIGIEPAQLEAFLGHPLTQMTTAELQDLRGIYAAIREGQTTWAEASETRGASAPAATTAPTAPASTERGTAGLKERVKGRAAATPAENPARDLRPGNVADALTPNAPTPAPAATDDDLSFDQMIAAEEAARGA